MRILVAMVAALGMYGCTTAANPDRPKAPSPPLGTWRDGFKASRAKALTFKNWEEMYDWAENGADAIALPLRHGRSTDLAGGRHDYIDTYAGGFKDGCIGLIDEMHFIGNHNTGDTAHFFRIMREWIQMQNTDETIPPGHF